MAELPNDTGAMRLALVLVARSGGGGQAGAPEADPAADGRLLVTVGLEYLDTRDGEWWPMVRLPPLYVPGAAIERLLTEQTDLLRGSSRGFAWRAAEGASVALQVALSPAGAIVEVGLDLGGFLADAAGVTARSDADLALFRFNALQRDLVRFADALACELEALRG